MPEHHVAGPAGELEGRDVAENGVARQAEALAAFRRHPAAMHGVPMGMQQPVRSRPQREAAAAGTDVARQRHGGNLRRHVVRVRAQAAGRRRRLGKDGVDAAHPARRLHRAAEERAGDGQHVRMIGDALHQERLGADAVRAGRAHLPVAVCAAPDAGHVFVAPEALLFALAIAVPRREPRLGIVAAQHAARHVVPQMVGDLREHALVVDQAALDDETVFLEAGDVGAGQGGAGRGASGGVRERLRLADGDVFGLRLAGQVAGVVLGVVHRISPSCRHVAASLPARV